jgi:hypothetical protein
MPIAYSSRLDIRFSRDTGHVSRYVVWGRTRPQSSVPIVPKVLPVGSCIRAYGPLSAPVLGWLVWMPSISTQGSSSHPTIPRAFSEMSHFNLGTVCHCVCVTVCVMPAACIRTYARIRRGPAYDTRASYEPRARGVGVAAWMHTSRRRSSCAS